MRQISRQKEWDNIRRKLKIEFEEKGITTCEICLPGCKRDNFLSFAHQHKRTWYYDKPKLLGAFEQVVLACIYPCYETIENNKKLTEEIFEKLRGPEKDILK